MAKKERRDTSKLRELMDEYGVKTMEDVHNFVKMLTAETIQTALDAELENELGYSKYDYKNIWPRSTLPKNGQCPFVIGALFLTT